MICDWGMWLQSLVLLGYCHNLYSRAGLIWKRMSLKVRQFKRNSIVTLGTNVSCNISNKNQTCTKWLTYSFASSTLQLHCWCFFLSKKSWKIQKHLIYKATFPSNLPILPCKYSHITELRHGCSKIIIEGKLVGAVIVNHSCSLWIPN